MRLYVDVDDTLINWVYGNRKIWDKTFKAPVIRNYPLINSIINWQQACTDREVVVWSGTGAEWASLAANTFFKDAIPIAFTGSKRVLFPILTSVDWSIDDREQKDRWYLKPFGKVFTPQGFIDYANTQNFQKSEKTNSNS